MEVQDLDNEKCSLYDYVSSLIACFQFYDQQGLVMANYYRGRLARRLPLVTFAASLLPEVGDLSSCSEEYRKLES